MTVNKRATRSQLVNMIRFIITLPGYYVSCRIVYCMESTQNHQVIHLISMRILWYMFGFLRGYWWDKNQRMEVSHRYEKCWKFSKSSEDYRKGQVYYQYILSIEGLDHKVHQSPKVNDTSTIRTSEMFFGRRIEWQTGHKKHVRKTRAIWTIGWTPIRPIKQHFCQTKDNND